MVEAGCGPDRALCITVTKWIGCPGWKSVYSDSLEELEEMLFEDIFKPYQLPTVGRNEITGAELEEWYIWFGYGDEP